MIKAEGFQPERPDWYIKEYGALKDTVDFWLRPGLPDTMKIIVSVPGSVTDTARFIAPKASPERSAKRKESSSQGMKINFNLPAGYLDLNKKLMLNFIIPVNNYFPGRISLQTPNDTIIPPFSFSDTLQRNGEISFKWLPGESYNLIIADSAFLDLNGAYNDSISVSFKVRALEDYSVLLMNISFPDTTGQYIVQLMSGKEILVHEKILSSPGFLKFEHLMPGNYSVKAIFDANSNGKWDAGIYAGKILPERVQYFTTQLVLRANWESQEEWFLEGE
jgi:hypothetical protein